MHEIDQSPYNYIVDQGKLNWIIDGYLNIVFLGRCSEIISCDQYKLFLHLISSQTLFQANKRLQADWKNQNSIVMKITLINKQIA